MCEAAAAGRPAVDHALLTHAARIDELAAIERQRAALDAREQRLLYAMHSDPLPNEDGTPAVEKMWVREDVACILRVAPQTATARLHLATELVSRLPATLAMLEAGKLSMLHVRRLVEASFGLPDAVVAKVERRVLPRAAQQSVGQFAASVRRAVIALDPRSAEERHRDALEERRIVLSPQPDGIVDLHAFGLRAPDAAAIAASVDAAAQQLNAQDTTNGATRTADQRRVDAFVDILTGTRADTGSRPLAPAVNVTVALSTVLGLDDEPGLLDGYGAVPAMLARALAFDPTGRWRRLLTDEIGRLVDVTSHTYRPPTPIARLVRLQNQTCCFPGCGRRAFTCELDHVVPWPDGETCAANLHPLCARHHHLKHEAGWRPAKLPDGTTRWTAPSGHTYARPPDELPHDATTDDDESSPFSLRTGSAVS